MEKIFNKLNNFHIAFLLFFIIALVHIDILFSPVGYYFSNLDLKDLNYYINIRRYAADILSSGNIPLWTLKIFSGHPFLANSETAAFYPLNFIFLFLPISKAINFSFLIHFFILSFSVFLWINNKIKNKPVSLLTAVVSVFSASYYMHSCAGHLSNIITMSWFALLLFLYDKTFETKNYKFIIPISAVIALQIFAGHFQYVYYTALVSLLYVLFFCFNKVAVITVFSSYFAAFCLSAVQILTSMDFYLQGARITGILQHISIKSKVSSLVTLIFADYTRFTSFFFWETSVYFGIFNALIILLAVFNNFQKQYLKYVLLAGIIYLLSYNRISEIAGSAMPLFNSFRSPVKLNFFVFVLLLPVLSYGFLQIFKKDIPINRYFVVALVFISTLIIIFHNYVSVLVTSFFEPGLRFHEDGLEASILFSGFSILFFSICLLLKKYVVLRALVLLIALIQPVIFARSFSKPFFFDNDYDYKQAEISYKNNDVRYFANDKYSLEQDYENIFGATSDALKNYIDFIKHLEKPVNINNIFGILRCQYVINDDTGRIEKYNLKFLKRVNVFYDYVVENDKDKIFSLLSDKNFDFIKTAVLEKEPKYPLKQKGDYKINILYLSGNVFDVYCLTTQPAVIVLSGNYEKGWKAYNIDDNNIKYEIIPADYIYRAISVDAGIHRIRFEYKPLSFSIGKWISGFAWLLIIFAIIYFHKKTFF